MKLNNLTQKWQLPYSILFRIEVVFDRLDFDEPKKAGKPLKTTT
ncbi:MAG: hypothetical protein NT163_06330 [Chlorobiales bacterium]|nr:hypothetical protein [Chlorobiales bacterium]